MSSSEPSTGDPRTSRALSVRLAVSAIVALFIASGCSGIQLSRAGSGQAEVEPASGQADGAPGVAVADPTATPEATRRPGRSRPTPDASMAPAAVTASPAPSSVADEPDAPEREVRTIRLKPRPKRGPFEMNLYRNGDFVHQATKDWCVAGSVQTMLNIIRRGRPNRSTAFQRQLYVRGRQLSPKAKLTAIGVDLIGWAALLNRAGHGPYVVDGAKERYAAVKKAARALRMTGRPVGLVVWRGAHSWVMSGFKATADPAMTRDFEVTAVYIQDVWYPYVSTIWGASRPPNALVPVSALGQDWLPYDRPSHRHPDRDGKFMIIMPTLPRNTVVR